MIILCFSAGAVDIQFSFFLRTCTFHTIPREEWRNRNLSIFVAVLCGMFFGHFLSAIKAVLVISRLDYSMCLCND